MERLTIRVQKGERKGECFIPGHKKAIEKIEYIHKDGRWEGEEYKGKAVDRLAEYEDLEEQGKLLKLPCAVGDVVYEIDPIGESIEKKKIDSVELHEYGVSIFAKDISGSFDTYDMSDFGAVVFLSKEEAEAALKVN